MKPALVSLVVLAGCAGAPSVQQSPPSVRPLVAPSTLGTERTVNQIVRGAIGTREMTMNCVVTIKEGSMTVVGLSAMGVRLFTIRYNGRDVQAEQSLPTPEQLTPQRLLADLQLVFWPLAGLQKPLAEAGWQLNEPAPGTRRLRRDGRLIAEVHAATGDSWNGRSWLVSLEHGYSLQIDSTPL